MPPVLLIYHPLSGISSVACGVPWVFKRSERSLPQNVDHPEGLQVPDRRPTPILVQQSCGIVAPDGKHRPFLLSSGEQGVVQLARVPTPLVRSTHHSFADTKGSRARFSCYFGIIRIINSFKIRRVWLF